MPSAAEYIGIASTPQGLAVTLLRSAEEFEHLSQDFNHLAQHLGTTAQPDFYAASLIHRRWAPAALAVWKSQHLIGVVYMKERKIAGRRSGIYYGDSTLNSLVASESQARRAVLQAAIDTLLKRPGSLAVRLLVAKDGHDRPLMDQIARESRLDISSKPVPHHETLPLPATYDDFLLALGSKTRRNFRYYRRKLEEAGHSFVSNLSHEHFCSAAASLSQKDVIGTEAFGLEHALSVLSSVTHPLLCGIRHKDGTWLSIFGGWYEGTKAVVVFQLNSSKEQPQLSLSLVMRAFVIEKLIEEGVRSMLFWGGMSEPLHHYATPMETERIYLDKPSTVWRTARACLRGLTSLVPQRWAHYADWILPPAN